MPEEVTGSRAGDAAGSVFQRTPATPSAEAINGSWSTFKEGLGDVGKDKSLEPIKDFKGLVDNHINAQKMIGRGLYLPDEKAKPEERQKAVDAIMKKLRDAKIIESAPESWEKYEIAYPKLDSGEEFQPNQELIDSFRQFAHKKGLPAKDVQEYFDWYLNFQTSAEAQEDKKFEDLKAGLKKEWAGLSTRKFEAARRAVAKFLGEDGDMLLGRMIPEDAVRMVKAFAVIGDPMLEEAMIQGERLGVETLADVDKKIKDMIYDKKHPLNDVSHPQHQEAVEQWSKLQTMYIQMGGK